MRAHCTRGVLRSAAGLSCAFLALTTSLAATSATARLTLDDFLSIRHPSQAAWSPDSERIAFLWEDGGVVELWMAAAGGGPPEPLAAAVDGAGVSGFDWAPDGRSLVYAQDGDLFVISTAGGPSRQITSGGNTDSAPAFSPDGSALAFLRQGQIWLIDAISHDERQLTDWEGTTELLIWSPEGNRLAALVSERRWVEQPVRDLVGRRMSFFARLTTPTDLASVRVSDGEVVWLERGEEYSSQPEWSSTGKIAWQQVSADAKRRRILVAAAPDWHPTVIVNESEVKWWSLSYLDAGPLWEPGGERVAFLSDRSGWTHLYVTDGRVGTDDQPLQVSRGEFDVEAPHWHPAGERIVFATNRGAATERSLFLVDIPADGGGPDGLRPISWMRGTSTAPAWSPDAASLLFLHADTRRPLDVWVQSPVGDEARQVTHSWPVDDIEEDLLIPEVVRFPSVDGRLIVAQLTLPADIDPNEPVPAVVWVHGGGIRQNRYGWHPLRTYAIFYGLNQYLAQQGYAVLAVDYRGSIGYGRDFRVAPHLDLGGGDLDDLLAAARYLRDLDDPRIGRVGIWGISYGGYLTVQALAQAPTAFDAGIDIAGVVDWEEWAHDPGGLWIRGRMGDVLENGELYRQRSPLHHIEHMAAPLLVLHGTGDDAVPVLQSLRLVDALVRSGKTFDVNIYPGETHTFTHRRTWVDAMRRVERFFAETLR